MNDNSSSRIKKAVQEKLGQMSELELTKKIILPLLTHIGYERVEYYGGPDEEGKDVIAWGKDSFGCLHVTAIQVKKLKPTRAAASKHSFSEIITQLSQALEKPIPITDGSTLRPSSVYLITPFNIDTKVLKSRFERVQELRHRNV